MKNLAPELNNPLPDLRLDTAQDRNDRPDSPTIPNLQAVKARQKATWESGDFGQIARTIENVAEEFIGTSTPRTRLACARRGTMWRRKSCDHRCSPWLRGKRH